MPQDSNRNEEIMKRLDIIIFWLKAGFHENTKKMFLFHLDTEEKKKVFELSDGDKSTRDIAQETGIPRTTIQKWWPEWEIAGLLRESSRYPGRKQKAINFQEIGIK